MLKGEFQKLVVTFDFKLLAHMKTMVFHRPGSDKQLFGDLPTCEIVREELQDGPFGGRQQTECGNSIEEGR